MLVKAQLRNVDIQFEFRHRGLVITGPGTRHGAFSVPTDWSESKELESTFPHNLFETLIISDVSISVSEFDFRGGLEHINNDEGLIELGELLEVVPEDIVWHH